MTVIILRAADFGVAPGAERAQIEAMETVEPSSSVMPRHPPIATLEAALAPGRFLAAELSERLAAIVAAAGPNSLRALRCDFALIAASQAARGKPPQPLAYVRSLAPATSSLAAALRPIG